MFQYASCCSWLAGTMAGTSSLIKRPIWSMRTGKCTSGAVIGSWVRKCRPSINNVGLLWSTREASKSLSDS
ncbi:hypothetical protein LOY47_29750 [Pseudomonas brassicacearum]|uniref:hypothetical protein n=1 Tax=Pseudomonas brassicacearum TaxID=930166 RepID=UPI002160FA21|nr:hypothetical protein [Pseudomonas brassicacearum]UVM44598.1 hypothetical protein LOY47_29750 [Pseudomonas brassicacearum]